MGHFIRSPRRLHTRVYHWVGLLGWNDPRIHQARCKAHCFVMWWCWYTQRMDGRYQGLHQDRPNGLPLSDYCRPRAWTGCETGNGRSWRKGCSRNATYLPCGKCFTVFPNKYAVAERFLQCAYDRKIRNRDLFKKIETLFPQSAPHQLHKKYK